MSPRTTATSVLLFALVCVHGTTGYQLTRTSISPSQCNVPTDCSYKCSATYGVTTSGSTATLTPATISGCTCYTGTAQVTNGVLSSASFTDGSTAVSTLSGCNLNVVVTTQGFACTGNYITSGSDEPACTPSSSSAPTLSTAISAVAVAAVAAFNMGV